MFGRNSRICHDCRAKDHFFNDCKRKRNCTRCKNGSKKYFVVEKKNDNKEKLFLFCSKNCEISEWAIKEKSSDQSSPGSVTLLNL